MSEDQQWTLRWRGRLQGPYSLEEIDRKLDDHEIGLGHEIRVGEEWLTLEIFLAKANQPKLPPKPGAADQAGRPASGAIRVEVPRSSSARKSRAAVADETVEVGPRRRLIYAFLAVAFGFTGLHNYYARHWLTGLLQLLLSIATSLLGYGFIASWLWAAVEAALVRRDGDDLEMS